jgi:chloramphenicol 3-O-phosphotransferase
MFATGNMTLVLVQVSDEELEKRRAARNNTQNETWMKGMQTRMNNLAKKYTHTVLNND